MKNFIFINLTIFFISVTACKKDKNPDSSLSFFDEEQIERLGELLDENLVTLKLDQIETTYVEVDSVSESALLLNPELFGTISDLAEDDEYIYITDRSKNQIVRYDKRLNDFQIIGQEGRGPVDFNYPSQVEINSQYVFVCDSKNYRIQILDKELIPVTAIDITVPLMGQTSFFNLNSEYLLVPYINISNIFSTANNVMATYKIDQDFEKTGSMMPVLIDHGKGGFGGNLTTTVTSDNQEFYVHYYGPPIIFIFDNQLNHKKTIRISGSYIDDFFQNVPERISMQTHPERISRQLIYGLGVIDRFMFLQIGGDLYQVDIDKMKVVNRYRFRFKEGDEFNYLRVKIYGDKLYLIDNAFNYRVVKTDINLNSEKMIYDAKLLLSSFTKNDNIRKEGSYE